MRIIDRFDAYMAYAHLTDNKVTNQLGLTNGVIGKSRKSGRDLSDRVIELIENYYDDLNIGWLRTGRGDMLKGPIELLADRLSIIIVDICNDGNESLEHLNHSFGLEYDELGQFTRDFVFPNTPLNFVKFLGEYPEYNYLWILTGEGSRFYGDDETNLAKIKARIYRKNLTGYFPADANKEDEILNNETHDNNLWEQIHFQNEQLKEKDAQIKQLLDILQKK